MPDIQINIKVAMQGATSAFSQLQAGVVTFNQALGAIQKTMRGVSQAYDQIITSTVEYGSQVKNLSRTIGATSEEASKLIQAGDDVGVSVESISTAMKGAIQRGYQPTIQGLSKIADQYNAIQSPIERSKYLLDTFGRSGLEMAALLERGSEGIRAMGDEAQRLGLVLSPQDVENVRQYKKALDDLGDSYASLQVKVGKVAIPFVTDFINNFVTSMDEGFWAQQNNYVENAPGNSPEGKHALYRASLIPRVTGVNDVRRAEGLISSAPLPLGPSNADITSNLLYNQNLIAYKEDKYKKAQDEQRAKQESSAAAAAQGGMNSSISDAYKEQNRLIQEQVRLMGELTQAQKDGSWRRANDAKKAIEENKQAQVAMGETVKKTTAEFITQQATQGVGTQQQIQAARATGEFSEYEFKLATAIEQAKTQYAGANDNGKAYGEAIQKIQQASDAANGDTAALTKSLGELALVPDIETHITTYFDEIHRSWSESGGGGSWDNGDMPTPGKKPKAYAVGGPVTSGNSILVGERGPEMFTPSGNGSIIPNHMLSTVQPGGGTGDVMIGGIYITGSGNARNTAEMTVKLLGRYVRDSRRAGGASVG